jgi:hypothetical protein
MKTTGNQEILKPLEREEIEKLTKGTTKQERIFSAAELWNIQRNRRTFRGRRLLA